MAVEISIYWHARITILIYTLSFSEIKAQCSGKNAPLIFLSQGTRAVTVACAGNRYTQQGAQGMVNKRPAAASCNQGRNDNG